ncbi:MAG: hypothetical protein KDH94_06250 [Coxiellaceae bacterium]|nr:hypothetical protein [Coxiellaceae bacterium]
MKTDKHYVSEIDKKLAEFDQTHPKSASQQAEIDKHKRVYALRDNPTLPKAEEEDFFY